MPQATAVSSSNQMNAPRVADGYQVGGAPTDLVGFYGATPVSQPTAAAQAAVVDGSGGTANPATGVGAIGATYVQATVANAFATVIAEVNALRAALVSLGIIKGA